MPQILIADTSDDVAQLVAVTLSQHGFVTEIRAKGEDPVQPPDVLVLDAGLRDAAELVRALRSRTPDLPIVATGIRSLNGSRPPLGALTYLIKPFSLDELAGAVAAAVPT
jgi:DNA-binding response OmpR family regulator